MKRPGFETRVVSYFERSEKVYALLINKKLVHAKIRPILSPNLKVPDPFGKKSFWDVNESGPENKYYIMRMKNNPYFDPATRVAENQLFLVS